MKLSEIRGERVFDVVADLIDPMANIAEDKGAMLLFRAEGAEDETVITRLRRGLPKLLRDHKADLVAIMAVLHDVEPEAYADGLTLATLFRDLSEMAEDDDLMAFLA